MLLLMLNVTVILQEKQTQLSLGCTQNTVTQTPAL